MDYEILKLAAEDNNDKYIKNPTHHSKLKNSLCGDEIQIKLIIKKDKIIDFGYHGKSCVYCKASASILSKISINKHKAEVNELCEDTYSFFEKNNNNVKKKWKLMNKLLKKKNQTRKDCILLPFRTLKKIVSI